MVQSVGLCTLWQRRNLHTIPCAAFFQQTYSGLVTIMFWSAGCFVSITNLTWWTGKIEEDYHPSTINMQWNWCFEWATWDWRWINPWASGPGHGLGEGLLVYHAFSMVGGIIQTACVMLRPKAYMFCVCMWVCVHPRVTGLCQQQRLRRINHGYECMT